MAPTRSIPPAVPHDLFADVLRLLQWGWRTFSDEDHEDIAQEVMATLWLRYRGLDLEAQRRVVRQIARLKALEHHRRVARRARSHTSGLAQPGGQDWHLTLSHDLPAMVETVSRDLGGRRASALADGLTLRLSTDCTDGEAARAVGLHTSEICRARNQLRDRLFVE